MAESQDLAALCKDSLHVADRIVGICKRVLIAMNMPTGAWQTKEVHLRLTPRF